MAKLFESCKGNWERIFSDIAKWDKELMNKKHQPCPRCGGKDRFRVMDDFNDTGGLICNKCTIEVIPNGIKALAWALDQDEKYVKSVLAERFKVRRGRPKNFEVTDWTPNLVNYFVASRPGVTEEAMRLAGVTSAKYHGKPVFAFPIYGQAGTVSGHVVMDAMGGQMWSPRGNCKILTVEGSTSGLVNKHAFERLKLGGVVKKVWKVEGVPDMLAMQGLIPPDKRDTEVVVTNSGGCMENPKWMAQVLSQVDEVVVVGDRDKPGVLGADKWSREIVLAGGKHVTICELPYEVEENHGKDLRDWIASGCSYYDLSNLSYHLVNNKVQAVGKRTVHEMLLDDLKLEVLGQHDGKVRCFSHATKKMFTVKMDLLNYHTMVMHCGPIFVEKVQEPWEKWDGARAQMNDFKLALATVVSSLGDKPTNERGMGIWQGDSSLVLVNNTHVSKMNGQAVLERKENVLVDGLVCELGSGHEDWYHHEELQDLVAQAADPAFRIAAVDQLQQYSRMFSWMGGGKEALLATGLVLATYMQSSWQWRPMISVVGESGCGKTTWFSLLGGDPSGPGIFGKLAIRMGHVTEAGLRQTIKSSGQIILIDEFEASRERAGILKTLRSSSRGDQVIRGSATGQHQSFSLRHMIWTATTESGLNVQPDINRFVQLNMHKRHVAGWKMPSHGDMIDLGRRLLASVIACGRDAASMAPPLVESYQGDRRVAENVAPAAAMLAAMEAKPGNAAAYLDEFVKLFHVASDDSLDPEHEELVSDIFAAQIGRGGDGRPYTVYDACTNVNLSHLVPGLQAFGLKMCSARGIDSSEFLFVVPKQTGAKLLRQTRWEYCRLADYLKRVPSVRRTTASINGRMTNGYAIPIPKPQTGSLDFVPEN